MLQLSEEPCEPEKPTQVPMLLAAARLCFNANHFGIKNVHRLADQWFLFKVPLLLAI